MIAWRTFACSVAVFGLAVTGCGNDMEPGGFTGSQASNTNNTTDPGTSSSSTSGTTSGTPPTSTQPDPTTGPDTTTTTTSGTTTGDDSTTEPDTTTTTTTATTQTTDPAGCGNGVIDPNEQCDGANLNGFTCQTLGNAGGSLGCDPVTCTFDTSMCMGNSSGGTSG